MKQNDKGKRVRLDNGMEIPMYRNELELIGGLAERFAGRSKGDSADCDIMAAQDKESWQ